MTLTSYLSFHFMFEESKALKITVICSRSLVKGVVGSIMAPKNALTLIPRTY